MDQGWSAAALAMLGVLAICFVALVLLVVTLPGVKRLLHIGPRIPAGIHRTRAPHARAT